LRVYVYMCSILTLICHSGHPFESCTCTCFQPTRIDSFQGVSVTFPLKKNFVPPHLCWFYWSCLTLTSMSAFEWVLLILNLI